MRRNWIFVFGLIGLIPDAVLAQDHRHHHVGNNDESSVIDSMSTDLWDTLAPALRVAFDSAYSSALEDQKAIDSVFLAYLDEIPAKAMLEYLDDRHPYCHNVAHDLGVAVYRHYGNLGVAVNECGDGCASACMHGAVREAFGKSTVDDVVASVDSVCTIDGMAEINRPANCAHALGHALMMATGDSLRASLEGCSKFPGLSLPHYCGTGVFMEYGAAHKYRDPGPKESELVSHFPCDEFGAFAASCYRYVGVRMRRVLDTDDPAVLAAECRKLNTREQLGCFRGLGVAFSGEVRLEPGRINTVCSDPNPDNELVCIDALVEQVSYKHPLEAGPICEEVDHEAEVVCLAALTGRYELYKPIMDIYLGTED